MASRRAFRIGEVAARTGLTERMIRHYEKLGLVQPERSDAGQRLYDADALVALGQVHLLKKAGMPLRSIERWLANPIDGKKLVKAQLAYLRNEADRIAQSLVLLKDIDSELSKGDEVTIDSLTRAIACGNDEQDERKAIAFFEEHFTSTQHNDWRDMLARLHQQVDAFEYDNAWRALISDIKAALPLAPDSERAQGFLDRWTGLLASFRRVATPEQLQLANTMWGNVDQWGAQTRQPATKEVIDLIREAASCKDRSKPNG